MVTPELPLANSTEKIEFKEFVFDGITYIVPSWEEMGDATFNLAKNILEDDKHFDRIITLAKSGWTWTRTLADYLNMDEIGTLRVKFYSDINQTFAEPKITQPTSCSVEGEDVLLFDEVIDSGESIKVAKSHLLSSGATSVQVATLCLKPRSIYTPEYYAFATSAWVVFPHEIREFIANASKQWIQSGHSIETIFDRLLELGLPPEQVSYFLP